MCEGAVDRLNLLRFGMMLGIQSRVAYQKCSLCNSLRGSVGRLPSYQLAESKLSFLREYFAHEISKSRRSRREPPPLISLRSG